MKSFTIKQVCIAALIALLIILTGWFLFVRPAAAKNEPMQPDNYLTQFLKLNTNSGYTNRIGLTADPVEGVYVTLDEFLIEDRQYSYSLLISGDLPENISTMVFHQMELMLDGKWFDQGLGGGIIFPVEGKTPAIAVVSTRNTTQWMANLPTTRPLTLTLTLGDLVLYLDGVNGEITSYEVEGSWTFEFEADGSATAAETHAIALNHHFSADRDYQLLELLITPASQRLYMSVYDAVDHPEVGTIGLRTDDDNLVIFRLSKTFSDDSDRDENGKPFAHLTFIPDMPKSDYAANRYDTLKSSKTLTIIPYRWNIALKNWESMPADTEGLEDAAFTILFTSDN